MSDELATEATHPASMGLHEAFDAVHDGRAQIIDPNKTALALFIMPDGQVQLKCPYSREWAAGTLRRLADKLDGGDHG